MAFWAVKFERTSVLIINDKISRTPRGAGCWLIIKLIRFSSIVLPIMSVNAKCLIVLCKVKGTPYRFKVKNVEIVIILEIVDELNCDIILWMSERTKYSIITSIYCMWVVCTKLGLVFLLLIKLFDPIVWHIAFIALGTIIAPLYWRTHLTRVETPYSFSVLIVMVEWALFVIMLSICFTR